MKPARIDRYADARQLEDGDRLTRHAARLGSTIGCGYIPGA